MMEDFDTVLDFIAGTRKVSKYYGDLYLQNLDTRTFYFYLGQMVALDVLESDIRRLIEKRDREHFEEMGKKKAIIEA
jgi:hypothetical protein